MHYSVKTTDFFQQVYQVCELIPEGRITSYGAIAIYLGAARSSRMVGWAMNASHNYLNVPAHRVVNRNGLLTGKFHFEGPKSMQRLLEKEGVEVMDDRIVEFDKLFWNPSVELAL